MSGWASLRASARAARERWRCARRGDDIARRPGMPRRTPRPRSPNSGGPVGNKLFIRGLPFGRALENVSARLRFRGAYLSGCVSTPASRCADEGCIPRGPVPIETLIKRLAVTSCSRVRHGGRHYRAEAKRISPLCLRWFHRTERRSVWLNSCCTLSCGNPKRPQESERMASLSRCQARHAYFRRVFDRKPSRLR